MRFIADNLKILIFLNLLLLVGCGTASDPGIGTNTTTDTSEAIGVRGGKEGITVITSKQKVRYLGIIENNGNQTFCFIDITFSTKGADGKSLDLTQGISETIKGFTLINFGTKIHSCLRPGQFGFFDTAERGLIGEFADFDYRICVNRNGICQSFPLAVEPRAPLVVNNLVEGENNGMRTYSVQIKNDADSLTAPNAIAYDVIIYFAVRNEQGKIVGTASFDSIASDNCPSSIQPIIPLGCIHPGIITQPFTINTDVPVSETCTGCSYNWIHHSE